MAFNRNGGSSRGGDRGGFRPRPSFGGDRGGFGGRGGDRGDRGPVEMHDAICDNCGKSCQVPFRPTSGKPIFCSECFEQKRGNDDRRFEGGGRPAPRFENRTPAAAPQNSRQLDEISAKLDKLITLLSPIEVPQEIVEEVVKPSKKSKKVVEEAPVAEEVV